MDCIFYIVINFDTFSKSLILPTVNYFFFLAPFDLAPFDLAPFDSAP